MHVGTFATGAPLIHTRRRGIRPLVLTALFATALLAGCASRTERAPVADQSSTAAASQQASGTYVVKPGDTLYKIAQAHGMEVARLSQLNNITNPSQLAIGQVLRLDGGTPMPPAGASQGSVATPIPVTPVEAPPAGEAATAGTAARASDASLISWAWPATGKIIQGFNSTTKGIDIEGAIGAPVQAAAEGKVMYAGNGVRGLGNLILLGHSNGFITAYAHNQSLLVKTGEVVKKGAKIATVGQSDTSSPRLHFEIRRRGTPVNPLSYLPAR
ncbi:peptidoglycan DD-metalloendopeptidase family protein [Castellaniella sp. GW247-6E4]|uniref:peptidoglycan DD-metalloendopeptidase family protein n=1 Tax=Castellaniella sp. GW247-6E4 TaxID=3140380 RepID=UPI0033148E3F